MNINKDSLKLFFGLKLKKIRQEKGFSLKEFSEKTQLSPSYLNEIEKGKKYPKIEKIIEISNTLGINFNNLVSNDLEPEFNLISEIMNSPLLKSFPFEFCRPYPVRRRNRHLRPELPGNALPCRKQEPCEPCLCRGGER